MKSNLSTLVSTWLMKVGVCVLIVVAGVQGVEPRPPEPEPGVLPLDDTPINAIKKRPEFNQPNLSPQIKLTEILIKFGIVNLKNFPVVIIQYPTQFLILQLSAKCQKGLST